ncbi:MAG: hypothetical protein K2N88_04775 [Muribaculaceae bacterium]|nr:hypothetical protein [Muribaculaceae bacterium]
MKTTTIIGLTFLAAVWVALVVLLLTAGGLTFKNLLLVIMSGIIVFVPLWKKYRGEQPRR